MGDAMSKKTKRVFFCDLDGTIASLYPVVAKKIEAVFDKRIEGDLYIYGAYDHNIPGATAEELAVIYEFFIEPSTYGMAEPKEHAAAILNEIDAAGEFHGYITRRHPQTNVVTRRWLQRHGFPMGKIYNPQFEIEKGSAIPPALATADEFYLIEDSLEEAKAFSRMSDSHKGIWIGGSERQARDLLTFGNWVDLGVWYRSLE